MVVPAVCVGHNCLSINTESTLESTYFPRNARQPGLLQHTLHRAPLQSNNHGRQTTLHQPLLRVEDASSLNFDQAPLVESRCDQIQVLSQSLVVLLKSVKMMHPSRKAYVEEQMDEVRKSP